MAVGGSWHTRLAVAAVAAAAFVFASTCYFAWQGADPLPYWDAWQFVDDFDHARDGTYSLAELLRPANEHRIALPRLFFFADYLWFEGSEKALVAAGLVMLGWLATFVARLAVNGTQAPRATRVATAGLVVTILFSGTQTACLGWSFAVQFMAQSLLPALACGLVLRDAPRPRHLLLAILCAVGATFSIASSLLLWPVLIGFALWVRLGRGALLALTAAGVACWWFYLHDRVPSAAPALGLADLAVRTVAWSLTHIGSVWQLGATAGLVAGAVGWLLLLVALAGVSRGDQPATRALAAIAVLWSLYSLAIGYGRHDLGRDEALAGRYAPGPLLFWAALLALHLRLATRVAWRRTLGMLACVLVGLLLYKQTKSSQRWLNIKEARVLATLSIWLGDLDRARCGAVCPHLEALPGYLAVLRTHRVSIFASPLAYVAQQPLAAHFRVAEPVPSDVAFLRFASASTETASPFTLVTGTLSLGADHGDALAGIDRHGNICGLGSLGWAVPRALRQQAPNGAARWFALVPKEHDPTTLRWFTLDAAQSAAHALPVLSPAR